MCFDGLHDGLISGFDALMVMEFYALDALCIPLVHYVMLAPMGVSLQG